MKKRFLIVILVAMLLSACGSFKSVKESPNNMDLTDASDKASEVAGVSADKDDEIENSELEDPFADSPKIDKDDFRTISAKPDLHVMNVDGKVIELNCLYHFGFGAVPIDEFASEVKDTSLKFDYSIDEENRTFIVEPGKNYSGDVLYFERKYDDDFVDVKMMPFYILVDGDINKIDLIKYNNQFFVNLSDLNFVNPSPTNIGSLSKSYDKDNFKPDNGVNATDEEIENFLKSNKAGSMITEIDDSQSLSKNYSFDLNPMLTYIFDSSNPNEKNSFTRAFADLDENKRQEKLDSQYDFFKANSDGEIHFEDHQRKIFFVKKEFFQELNYFPLAFFLDSIQAYLPDSNRQVLFDVYGASVFPANHNKDFADNKLIDDNVFRVSVYSVDFSIDNAVCFPEGVDYDKLYKDIVTISEDNGLLIQLEKDFDQSQEDKIYILVVFI